MQTENGFLSSLNDNLLKSAVMSHVNRRIRSVSLRSRGVLHGGAGGHKPPKLGECMYLDNRDSKTELNGIFMSPPQKGIAGRIMFSGCVFVRECVRASCVRPKYLLAHLKTFKRQ